MSDLDVRAALRVLVRHGLSCLTTQDLLDLFQSAKYERLRRMGPGQRVTVSESLCYYIDENGAVTEVDAKVHVQPHLMAGQVLALRNSDGTIGPARPGEDFIGFAIRPE